MARNLTGNIYWMQTQSFLRLHLHLKSGCGNGRSGRTLILSITESEHGPPNKRQQYQKYCHSNATAKRKGHLMIQDDEYHQITKGTNISTTHHVGLPTISSMMMML